MFIKKRKTYFSFVVAVMGHISQQTNADMAVPIVTIANISSMYVGSKSDGITEPSLTSTGNIIINPKPQPIYHNTLSCCYCYSVIIYIILPVPMAALL